MVDQNALAAANARRWADAQLTRAEVAAEVARRLHRAKSRYRSVEAETGVPWPIVAVIHERESSQSWRASLAQGDPWDRISLHVPAGRGPFTSWEAAAADALVNCPPFLARRTDWSLAKALTALEMYNGTGYAARGEPSPYLWAGTNQYRSGKYIRDGLYDASKVDPQLGCAAMMKALMAIDPGIIWPDAAAAADVVLMPRPSKQDYPTISNPAKGSIGAFAAGLVAGLFKKKK